MDFLRACIFRDFRDLNSIREKYMSQNTNNSCARKIHALQYLSISHSNLSTHLQCNLKFFENGVQIAIHLREKYLLYSTQYRCQKYERGLHYNLWSRSHQIKKVLRHNKLVTWGLNLIWFMSFNSRNCYSSLHLCHLSHVFIGDCRHCRVVLLMKRAVDDIHKWFLECWLINQSLKSENGSD